MAGVYQAGKAEHGLRNYRRRRSAGQEQSFWSLALPSRTAKDDSGEESSESDPTEGSGKYECDMTFDLPRAR